MIKIRKPLALLLSANLFMAGAAPALAEPISHQRDDNSYCDHCSQPAIWMGVNYRFGGTSVAHNTLSLALDLTNQPFTRHNRDSRNALFFASWQPGGLEDMRLAGTSLLQKDTPLYASGEGKATHYIVGGLVALGAIAIVARINSSDETGGTDLSGGPDR